MTRLGESFSSNCSSFFETESTCSACDAGFYFDVTTNSCVACTNNCFFCEAPRDFSSFKSFLQNQHLETLDYFANQLYLSAWFKEEVEEQASSGAPTTDASTDTPAEPPTPTDPLTDTSNDPSTDPSNDPPSDPNATNLLRLSEKPSLLEKIIASHQSTQEEDLKDVQAYILEAIFKFEQVEKKTCPLCMKGFSQLESQVCVNTEVYMFSLGLSLF